MGRLELEVSKMKLVTLILVFSAAGCSVFFPALTEKGAKVRLMKADPPAQCEELGAVRGDGSLENAKIRMRNRAAELGGNYVRWETISSNGTTADGVTGTAFACNELTSSSR